MEDVINRIPHANQSAINSIQLYLRVLFLLELTNANGTTILPHMLQNGPRRLGSTIHWPQKPILPPDAWKHWQQAIQELYLQTNSDCLLNPLKEWNEATNADWHWEWHISLTTLDLYQWNGC